MGYERAGPLPLTSPHTPSRLTMKLPAKRDASICREGGRGGERDVQAT